MPGAIRVGIGGWTFPEWRGGFYPPGLPHAQELAHAGAHLSSIEINGTFYRTQSAESFAKWRDTVPADFVFSVKAPRAATHRRALADSAQSIQWFLDSGVLELGRKLGPILWQFPPTRQFDAAAMSEFLDMLPPTYGGVALRHVIEARHPSFDAPDYYALLRPRGVAAAIVDSDKQTLNNETTAQFVYLRLQRNRQDTVEGYESAALDDWAQRARNWAADHADSAIPGRDVYVYFISGDKARAPDAAMALLKRLGSPIDAVPDRDLRQA